MGSEAQREASRKNGAKSKGPVTPEGKAISRMNGLKHGLRAEQVILPGEDPAEYEAERQGWLDDWKPLSHTRAVLCERAAHAAWRLRRCARSEVARLRENAEGAAIGFENERRARVHRAVARFDDDPGAAISLLLCDAAGADRLIALWSDLAEALSDGPAGWSDSSCHTRLRLLLNVPREAFDGDSGPVVWASARLLRTNDRAAAVKARCANATPLKPSELEPAAATIRAAIAGELAGLRSRRSELPDPESGRARAVAAAYADTSKEAQLRHRYEMAHERSLRATINQLASLARSGVDLGSEEAEEVEVKSTEEDKAENPCPTSGSGPAASGSLGAASLPEAATPAPTPSGPSNRDRGGRSWPAKLPGGGR